MKSVFINIEEKSWKFEKSASRATRTLNLLIKSQLSFIFPYLILISFIYVTHPLIHYFPFPILPDILNPFLMCPGPE